MHDTVAFHLHIDRYTVLAIELSVQQFYYNVAHKRGLNASIHILFALSVINYNTINISGMFWDATLDKHVMCIVYLSLWIDIL